MSYRFMRIIVFFDLPTTTNEDIREYNRFRKCLLKHGFIMMQQSVYTKLVLNSTSAEIVKETVRKNKAKKGLVQMFSITEKQFNSGEILVGSSQSTVIDSDKRLVIL